MCNICIFLSNAIVVLSSMRTCACMLPVHLGCKLFYLCSYAIGVCLAYKTDKFIALRTCAFRLQDTLGKDYNQGAIIMALQSIKDIKIGIIIVVFLSNTYN